MNLRSRSLSVFAIVGLLLGMMPVSPVQASTTVSAGDLIRGTSFSAVYYYGEDGFRYVFPNEKTYKTWYSDAETGEMDFSTVKMMSDAELAKIQMGGNVTYHPGSRMIKINSDPKTYFVTHGGVLRWVSTEADAIAMYGADWNTKIDDVPDAFFGNYRTGSNVETTSDFDPAAASASTDSIDEDKHLKAATVLNVSDNSYDNTSVTIKAGTAVRWFNNGANKHTATATDLSWGTGTISPGGNFARYFNDAGTYTYFCSYHPEMTATIIVE